MKNTARLLLVATLLAPLPSLAASSPLSATGLRVEWLPDPCGVGVASPRLSWRVEAAERGQRQTAFRILVAGDAARLAKDEGDLWDSGRVDADETLNIVYAGKPLRSGQRAFWKVKAWDRTGVETAWSGPATWTMGVLRPEDWKADWISFRDTTPLHTDRGSLHLPPARHYRRAFDVKKPVARAVLHAAVLGIADFQVNGRRVGDGYFETGWADYAKRAYSRTHDVTALLQEGANALGAVVADGWYAGYVGYGLLVGYGPHKTGRNFYGKTPALLAQLEIEYADGSRETVATDASWQVSGDGPVREADLIMGESFDAARERPDWCRPGGAADWTWQAAVRAAENGSVKAPFSDNCGTREIDLGFRPPPVIQPYAAPPIRVTQELPARAITEPKPGTYIFDLGQNFAGVIRLQVRGPAGTRLQIRYGEMLHPDGRLMTENLRRARATDFYTLRGDANGETWSPRFTYHGFQFVEIAGLPAKPGLDAVTGLVLQNDTPPAGSFACSDEVLTQFGRNAQWTQRANFIEVPTDCPQRDERLGWMGDAQVYCRTAAFNADVAAFFTKWVDDVREAQRDSGAYPDYCPYPMGHGAPNATHGTAWTDAGVIVPYTMWKTYGDTRILERHWDSMARFMAWRAKADPELKGVKIGNTWGDWLNVNENTPIEYIDICYHTLDAKMMYTMATVLGRKAEAQAFDQLVGRLRASFAQHHLAAAEGMALPRVDTQTALVLALWAGMLPDAKSSQAAAAKLADKIGKNGFRMATGFLGTRSILPALSDNGHHDLAVRLFQSRAFPSWGYEVVNGANTVWERWDSFTKEHGFNGASGKQNAAMNSFSHYAFGAVMEWAYRYLAGIGTLGTAYKRIELRPRPPAPGSNPDVSPVDWVRAEHDCARGRIVSSWKRDGATFTYDVTIPANTTAVISIPAAGPDAVTEGGKAVAQVAGLKVQSFADGVVTLTAESGSYRFATRLSP